MKTCSICKKNKAAKDYYFKNKAQGRLHAQCKICYAEKRKLFFEDHYRKYGDQYRKRARERKNAIIMLRQEQLVEYLIDKKCEQCGFNDISALDFDHIDPITKRFGIARGIRNCYAWSEIEKEIKKCRILCSNCHRIRTAEQNNWRKWRLGGMVTQSSAKAFKPVRFR